MSAIQVTLTRAGLAALIADEGAAFSPAVITQIGLTHAAFTVASTLTALPGEFKRLSVSGEAAGDDVLHIIALDDSADIYAYSGFGIYLDDGTLFAVYGQADDIAGKAEVSATYIVTDIALGAGQSANVTFGDTTITNPPATTTRQGVVELATNAEAKAGVDALRALTPAAAKSAVLDWIGYTPLDEADFTGAAVLALITPMLTTGTTNGVEWERGAGDVLRQWGQITLTGGTNVETGTLPLPHAFQAGTWAPSGNLHFPPQSNWHNGTVILRVENGDQLVWTADTTDIGHQFQAGQTFSFSIIGRIAA
ncbi:hypothetical protein GTZ99_03140 [Novosphingobium sp. FSY-8]|uniref:Tail-collar fiber protein n=1 Tax=Novosphingobium ovatum TaxID=1908523 RepID=A0ABW9XAI6_9SPHN|nr:hypothetical protein [Novosphingobium ovatum]NBC35547.1 hypothetical protein [Novosphingobium ovatum]